MPQAECSAHVEWEGNLLSGRGTFTVGSGAIEELSVNWVSRVERPDGKTSPEELLTAAHASYYAMALSHNLAGRSSRSRWTPWRRSRRLMGGSGSPR